MTKSDVEIELKIPVNDLTAVRDRLREIDAGLDVASAREVNILLDSAEGRLAAAGAVLRLRRYSGHQMITFKGPASYQGAVKFRTEHETTVENLEAMQLILEDLGFSPVARYEKDRESWRVGAVVVVLDHTPMGDFVEVEGPRAEIESVANKLALDPASAVRGSYLALWRDYRQQRPELALPRDMVFEA